VVTCIRLTVESLASRSTQPVAVADFPSYRSAFWKSMQYEHPVWSPQERWAVERVAIGVPLRGPCRGRVGILRPRYPSNDRPVHRSLRWGAGPDPEPVQRRHGHDERLQGRVTSDGSGWAFSSEGSAIADDAPVLAQPLVPINSAKAFVPASIELSQDYPDWMSEISKVLTRGYVDLMA